MTRLLALSLFLGALTACAQYREPRAPCFTFNAAPEHEGLCNFVRLGGADPSAALDE